jgi:hypothetical protein
MILILTAVLVDADFWDKAPCSSRVKRLFEKHSTTIYRAKNQTAGNKRAADV